MLIFWLTYKMSVGAIDRISVSDDYVAKIYGQQIEAVRAQQIIDRRQKIKEEEKAIESSRLNQYNEEQRLARNQRIYKQFKDMELYLFKCRELQLQENKNLQVGTKVDLYC
jgi:hypothetical protein